MLIVSMIIGTMIGEAIDLDDKINRLGKFLEKKFSGKTAEAMKAVEEYDTERVAASKGNLEALWLKCFVLRQSADV